MRRWGIPEYWLIDPQAQTVTVLQLRDRAYVEVGIFRQSDSLISPSLPDVKLTVNQILEAGD